jgi:hypothetical protein
MANRGATRPTINDELFPKLWCLIRPESVKAGAQAPTSVTLFDQGLADVLEASVAAADRITIVRSGYGPEEIIHRFEAEARLGSLPSHLMRVLLKCELSVRFLTNRPVNPDWAMSDTIATNDGTQIYYKNWGAGQPVVFSRGWPLSADA